MNDTYDLTLEEQRLVKIVNKGIEQVVVPALDELEKEIKREIKKVSTRLDGVETRLEQMDRKLDKVTEISLISFDNKNHWDTLESLPTIKFVAK